MANFERNEDPNGSVVYVISSDYGKGTLAFDPVEMAVLDRLLSVSGWDILHDVMRQSEWQPDTRQRFWQAFGVVSREQEKREYDIPNVEIRAGLALATEEAAALVDRMDVSQHQRVALDEDGITWLVQAPELGKSALTMRLDAAAATRLFDFLLLYQERLTRWRDGFTP